jgi:hypothetical protein
MSQSGIPPPAAAGPGPPGPRLTALSADELATLLEKSGAGPVTPAEIAAATGQGAPINADGTFHFTTFVAWLARQAP